MYFDMSVIRKLRKIIVLTQYLLKFTHYLQSEYIAHQQCDLLNINRSSYFTFNIYFSCWTIITRGRRVTICVQSCYLGRHATTDLGIAECFRLFRVVAKGPKGCLFVGFSSLIGSWDPQSCSNI